MTIAPQNIKCNVEKRLNKSAILCISEFLCLWEIRQGNTQNGPTDLLPIMALSNFPVVSD